MAESDRAAHIAARAAEAGVPVSQELAAALAAYVDLLAFWNRTINLTALALEPPTDEAIDRLIVEPLLAARHVRPEDRLAIDIGSGGGSPAIPMRLAAPGLRVVLVEVKSRKAAFLRAVARELGLSNVEVENRSFNELLSRRDLQGAADLITVRAVRVDAGVMKTVQALLRPAGRLFWFGAVGGIDALAEADFLTLEESERLTGSGQLSIVRHRQE